MALPMMVYAEAILWSRSKEQGFTSILDPKAEPTPQNLKKFYADPAKVKAAVALLKEKGFSVYAVDKTSISIGAPPAVYESAFPSIKLVGMEVDQDSFDEPTIAVTVSEKNSMTGSDDQSSTQINTEGSDFQSLLAGIVLAQPDQDDTDDTILSDPPLKGDATTGIIKPDPPTRKYPERQLYLSDLPGQLGWGDLNAQEHNGEGVEIIIIDTGCYTDHPYFKGKNIKVITPLIIKEYYKSRRIELSNELKLLQEKRKKHEEAFKKYKNPLYKKINLLDQMGITISEEINLHKTMLSVRALMRREDINGHGTAMAANTLAIAPNAKITMIKRDKAIPGSSRFAFNWIQEKYNQHRNVIISCSFGPSWYKLDQPTRNKMRIFAIENEKQKHIICFAVGNKGKKNPDNTTSPYAKLLGVIGVGGANQDHGSLGASDVSLASKKDSTYRSLPDICAWCGSSDYSWLAVPVSPLSPKNNKNIESKYPGWRQFSGGTSSATAQIAGVCALIKAKWPDAGWLDVLELLVMNDDELTDDRLFATGLRPSDVENVGMVNIQQTIEATMEKVKTEASK